MTTKQTESSEKEIQPQETETKDEGQTLERFLADMPQNDEDETTDGNETDENLEGKKPSKSKPTDLNSLAETLGVEVKDLYELQIPSAREGEQPYTLGKLKDLASEQDDFTIRNLQFEELKRTKETEFSQIEDELKTLMSALPESALKPEVLKQVRAKRDAMLTQERAATLEAIPEWKDEELRTQELKGIIDHLKGWGFPDNYLQKVADHRTIKYLRDNYRRDEMIKKALAKVSESKSKTPKRSGATHNMTKGKRTSGDIEDQRAMDFLSALQPKR